MSEQYSYPDGLAPVDPGMFAATTAVSDALYARALQVQALDASAGGLPIPPQSRRLALVDDEGPAGELRSFALPPAVNGSMLGRLRYYLRLDPFATALVALCLLAEIDTSCRALIAYIQGDIQRARPTLGLAIALFAPDPERRDVDLLPYMQALAPAAPLRRWEVVTLPHEGDEGVIDEPLRLDRAVTWFLLGDYSDVSPPLSRVARLGPWEEVVGVPLPPTLEASLAPPTGRRRAHVLLHGADRASGLAIARAAAQTLDRDLLLIDGDAVAGLDNGPAMLRRCLREAVLKGWLPCVTSPSRLVSHSAPRAPEYRSVLDDCPWPTLLLAEEGKGGAAAWSGVVPVAVPEPDVEARVAQWWSSAATRGIAAPELVLRTLAETTRLAGAETDAVADLATTMAAVDGAAPDGTHLQRAARETLRARETSLTLLTPRFGWDDLILPEDRLQALRHLCSRVRQRSLVLQARGLRRGSLPGVTALFAGEPGTGKSMAAEVVAAELGLDLCRIDLSQVVDKYIGETEKNLGRLFDDAEASGAVLVFDEADAIFAKRGAVQDSHDRYANLQTSYLLARLERYRGLAILTTNLRANMDEAFTRRITVQVEFPLPDAADRLRLWRSVLEGSACQGLDLAALADVAALPGGAIMNAALTAAHLAAEEGGPIDGPRLLRALRGEFRKMGQLFDDRITMALAPEQARAHMSNRPGLGRY